MTVPYEINTHRKGSILLVGRDPGTEETREGRPFVGKSGRLLNDALTAAGLRRQDVNIANAVTTQPAGNLFENHSRSRVAADADQLHQLIASLQPNIVVALGNEAAYTLVPDWPTKGDGVFGAYGVTDRRGYLWEGIGGVKVLTTVHPASCLVHRDPSGQNGMFLIRDLERAKQESLSPAINKQEPTIHIVFNADTIAEARRALHNRVVAVDIECEDEQTLTCVGFAASTKEAWVFTKPALGAALELLQTPAPKVFQNGQFDVYFLKTRSGIKVVNWQHDTMIAFHAAWPEIAGKGERGTKKTRKSLAFLASMFCASPMWWKEYEWSEELKIFHLNGRDCCITLEVHEALQKEIDELGVRGIYEHEMRLVQHLIPIQEKGLRIDDAKRVSIMSELQQRKATVVQDLSAMIAPLLAERRDLLKKPKLFFKKQSCRCCGGGKKKAAACWACVGFEKAPGKRDLQLRLDGGHSMKKAELEAAVLSRCAKCDGAGSFESFEFNPNSNDQVGDILYNALKLPVRYNDGKPTVDETALKGLLGGLTNG